MARPKLEDQALRVMGTDSQSMSLRAYFRLPNGREAKFVDATEPLTFYLREEECQLGVPNDPTRCTLALMLKRVLPEGAKVAVLRSRLYIQLPGERKVERHGLSPTMRSVIVDTDLRREVARRKEKMTTQPLAATSHSLPADRERHRQDRQRRVAQGLPACPPRNRTGRRRVDPTVIQVRSGPNWLLPASR